MTSNSFDDFKISVVNDLLTNSALEVFNKYFTRYSWEEDFSEKDNDYIISRISYRLALLEHEYKQVENNLNKVKTKIPRAVMKQRMIEFINHTPIVTLINHHCSYITQHQNYSFFRKDKGFHRYLEKNIDFDF